MVDPVSGERITLSYGGDGALSVAAQPPCTSTATGVAACATPGTGFVVAPGMLCEVTYPDGRQTKLSYVGPTGTKPQLASIEDPGAVITDFAYGAGRLDQILGIAVHVIS